MKFIVMNFISKQIYPQLERLAKAGYQGIMLTKWEGGMLVKAFPQKQFTLADMAKALEAETLDKAVVS